LEKLFPSFIFFFNFLITHFLLFCFRLDSPGDQGISIILNGLESELKFLTDSKGNKVANLYKDNFFIIANTSSSLELYFHFILFVYYEQDQIDGCDGFLVIYSVVDKASFTRAEYFLTLLQDMDLLRSRCCILVGNKIDLARSRAISSQGKVMILKLMTTKEEQKCNQKVTIEKILFQSHFIALADGKCMACTYRVKFIEVSVGINHNVDELLAGTLTQIRLKKEHCELQV
jgi:hypothetical protein